MMTKLTRRQFIQTLGLTSLATLTPRLLTAATPPRIIIVGGGMAGATVAKYLKLWGTSTVDVTLIEGNAQYTACILSNLVLNNQLTLAQLTFNYTNLTQQYGVKIINDWVDSIDTTNHSVILRSGGLLSYDRLVIAPGISFIDIPGLDFNKVPHAWKAGPQTELLKQQLAAMPNGGSFVMTIPAAPYRCPPGPYERACVIADYLKRNKPGATITVLDANPNIIAERSTFEAAFNGLYSDILTYVPNVNILSVDSDAKTIYTSIGSYQANVLNILPNQSANSLIINNNLANVNGRWAGVNPLSYESTIAPYVHIVGDAQATGQPKSGHMANAEAKVCADAILRLLAGQQPFNSPTTNSACYSPITVNTASWLTTSFAYDAATKSMKSVLAAAGEASAPSTHNYSQMFDWANNLFSDSFM